MGAAFGLLGGTFDPIHHGHLRLAVELAEALGLDAVRFLPTGTPPHREQPAASAEHRLAMVKLAIAGNPGFVLDEHEVHKTEPCYMVDTLAALRQEVGTAPIVLFIGTDAFSGLTGWHQWQRLFELAHIAIARRPGDAGWQTGLPEVLGQEFATRQCQDARRLRTEPSGSILLHTITQLDISASNIRDLLASEHDPRYLLPDAVLGYIHRHRLYR